MVPKIYYNLVPNTKNVMGPLGRVPQLDIMDSLATL